MKHLPFLFLVFTTSLAAFAQEQGIPDQDAGLLKIGGTYLLKQGGSSGSVSGSQGYIGQVRISGASKHIKVSKYLGDGMYEVFEPYKGPRANAGRQGGIQKYNYDEKKPTIINIKEWPEIKPWGKSSDVTLNTMKHSDSVQPSVGDPESDKVFTAVGEGGFKEDALSKCMDEVRGNASRKNSDYEIISEETEKGAYKWMAKVSYRLVPKQ
jgi:hypothetical protein